MAKHQAERPATIRAAALLAQARRNERGEVPGTPQQRTTMAKWLRSRAETLMAQQESVRKTDSV